MKTFKQWKSSEHAYNSTTTYNLAHKFEEDSAMHTDAKNWTSIRSRFGSQPLQNIGGSEENPEQESRGIPIQPNVQLHGNSPMAASPRSNRGQNQSGYSQPWRIREIWGHVPEMKGNATYLVIVFSSDAWTTRNGKVPVGSICVRRKKNLVFQLVAEATLQGSES